MKFLLLFFFSFSAFAEQSASEKKCETLKALPDKNVVEATADCESYLYYYGFSGKKGDEEARKCAYRELKENSLVFGGSSVLMMIYANGRGVKKDIDLALKYACMTEGAPAELDGRLKHLEELRKKNETFDVCDDITSGFMSGHCTRIITQKDREAREAKLEAIKKSWSPAEIAAFVTLKTAHDKFEEERTNKEVDLSGSARSQFMIEEEEIMQKSFLGKIERFEKGDYPPGIADNNKQLNEVYQIIMAQKEEMGTLTAKGCRETQRTWIKFRDAWLAFAKVRYPKLVQLHLLRELTADRLKQLEELKSNFTE